MQFSEALLFYEVFLLSYKSVVIGNLHLYTFLGS